MCHFDMDVRMEIHEKAKWKGCVRRSQWARKLSKQHKSPNFLFSCSMYACHHFKYQWKRNDKNQVLLCMSSIHVGFVFQIKINKSPPEKTYLSFDCALFSVQKFGISKGIATGFMVSWQARFAKAPPGYLLCKVHICWTWSRAVRTFADAANQWYAPLRMIARGICEKPAIVKAGKILKKGHESFLEPISGT